MIMPNILVLTTDIQFLYSSALHPDTIKVEN